MSKHTRSPLALAIAFSLFAALPVMAQDAKKDGEEAKSDKATTMEQITVTAATPLIDRISQPRPFGRGRVAT